MKLSGSQLSPSEGKDKTRLHLNLLSAPVVYDSDLITDTEKLRRNCITACHWREGSIHEWTFSNGVCLKKIFDIIIFAYKSNACSLDTFNLVYNLPDDFLCIYLHNSYLVFSCYRLFLFKNLSVYHGHLAEAIFFLEKGSEIL